MIVVTIQWKLTIRIESCDLSGRILFVVGVSFWRLVRYFCYFILILLREEGSNTLLSFEWNGSCLMTENCFCILRYKMNTTRVKTRASPTIPPTIPPTAPSDKPEDVLVDWLAELKDRYSRDCYYSLSRRRVAREPCGTRSRRSGNFRSSCNRIARDVEASDQT